LGEGNGGFYTSETYFGAGGLILVGDFNGDGILDLVASQDGAAELLGNGDGTFQPPVIYDSPIGGPWAAGDLNGDHRPDLILFGYGGEDYSVASMLNTGALSFDPSSPLTFPVTLVGATSSPVSVSLTNTRSRDIPVSSIAVSGEFELGSGTTCQTSISGGSSCIIEVVSSPQSAGLHVGLVMIVDGASSKPQVVELSGRGTTLKVAPATLGFGSQDVGTKSRPQKFTVTNEAGAAAGITSIGVGGRNFRDFSETNTCGSILDEGASCVVSVTFSPASRGPRSAEVYINVSPEGGSPAPVILSGDGT
jgi:FG-GAP-like repeat